MINALPGGGSRAILLSRRANIFYLDRVRVTVRHERVVYRQEQGDEYFDYNLPDCNTALVLLGKGSSITDAAIRALAKSGVVVGFCGTGGTPAHALVDYVFLNPADEYRPTEYCVAWMTMWLDDARRLEAAKLFQKVRMENTERYWSNHPVLKERGISVSKVAVQRFENALTSAANENDVLSAEAVWTKTLYRDLCRGLGVQGFTRDPGVAADSINRLLDHGNYLVYGCATVALHALGIPPAFPLVHGKTRRGALVFDVADVLKDALVMPLAFEHGAGSAVQHEKEFRAALIVKMQETMTIDRMIETIKLVCHL